MKHVIQRCRNMVSNNYNCKISEPWLPKPITSITRIDTYSTN